ncbi:MAG: hypothetical protein IJF38_00825 [Clostridia bacterium]|nr:hypothetical protein [Clostridia bacterium]
MKRIKVMPKKAKRDTTALTKRVLLISVCILLGLVMILGATLGIVSGVRRAKALVYFDGIDISEGEARYLVSYYKAQYMANLSRGGVSVSDTPEFWSSKVFGDSTYLDYLRISTESYLRQLTVANKIFDKNTSLTGKDRDNLKIATEEILSYRAQGSKSTFGELCKKYGFDYSDFVSATEKIYKGWSAKTKIFGDKGENMSLFPDYCEEFLEYYTHVDLLFIRTEEVFVYDEAGNRVVDDDGSYKTRPLTAEERAEREVRLEAARRAINGINAGTVTPERFYELLAQYGEGDKSMDESGYYFHRESEYTKEFSEVFDEIVLASYELEEGMCCEIECDIGRCFIRRVPVTDGAYLKTGAVKDCFSDFYSLTSDLVYQRLIDEDTKLVELRDIWSVIDLQAIPYNTDFVARL